MGCLFTIPFPQRVASSPFHFLRGLPQHLSISSAGCLFTNPFPQWVASSPFHFLSGLPLHNSISSAGCLFTIAFPKQVASSPFHFLSGLPLHHSISSAGCFCTDQFSSAGCLFTIPFRQRVASEPTNFPQWFASVPIPSSPRAMPEYNALRQSLFFRLSSIYHQDAMLQEVIVSCMTFWIRFFLDRHAGVLCSAHRFEADWAAGSNFSRQLFSK